MESESSENDENNSFINKNEILFKKYKVIKKLGSGSFGDIYLGISLLNNSYVAIKTETKKIPNQHLETEAYFLYILKSVGIPEILSFGKTKDYNILIEPFLGKSLYQLYEENNRYFRIKDICLMGIQILDRLEWIHSKNIIHRDIKPDNFLIGNKDPNTIYLIDFGLSAKYRSSKTGKHKKFGFTGKLTGTTKYSSANTIRGVEQSRKDDLISVAYMIIFFMKGNLPWQDIDSEDEVNKFTKIYLMKKNIKESELCAGLPVEIYKFLKYVQNLDFEEKPNYDYLRSLFIDLLKKKNIIYNERLVFSWVNPKISMCKSPSNMINRKSNFHQRLYKKIENNLEISQKNLFKERKMKIIDYKRINSINNFHKYIPLSKKILLNNHSKNKNELKIGTKSPFDYFNNINRNFGRYGKRNNFNNSVYNERMVNNFDKDEMQPSSLYIMSTEKIDKK
jgi:casein kinase I family protein HRR25